MDKKIEDYIPLYLGCQVKTPDTIGINVGLFYPQVWAEDGRVEPNGVNVYYPEHKTIYVQNFNQCTLILRPLSDMTEKDIYKIVSIMLGKEVDFLTIYRSETDFITARYKDEESIFPQYDRVHMGINVSNIGSPFRIDNVWNFIKNGNTGVTHEPLHNHHEITRWLLSQCFDLFGLIESGLAIDATTFKNHIKHG